MDKGKEGGRERRKGREKHGKDTRVKVRISTKEGKNGR